MKPLILLCLALFECGCVPFNYNATAQMHRDKSNIKNNILITGQPRNKFQSIWGAPTKTYSLTVTREGAQGSISWGPWGGGGSFATNPGQTYDIWFYEKRAVTLIFHKEELAGWHWGSEPPEPKNNSPVRTE